MLKIIEKVYPGFRINNISKNTLVLKNEEFGITRTIKYESKKLENIEGYLFVDDVNSKVVVVINQEATKYNNYEIIYNNYNIVVIERKHKNEIYLDENKIREIEKELRKIRNSFYPPDDCNSVIIYKEYEVIIVYQLHGSPNSKSLDYTIENLYTNLKSKYINLQRLDEIIKKNDLNFLKGENQWR